MFEAAELGRTISKEDYRQREPVLRASLLQAQTELRTAAAFPVIVVFAGVDGAGKGDTVNLLNEWMDPRWIVTRAFGDPSDEEQERPEYWRYWRALPARGRIGLFLSSWYSRPVLDRVAGRLDANALEERLNRIVEFEQTLAEDGALILKFWMHLDKARQKKHLKSLEKDRRLRWKVTAAEWKNWRMYDRFIDAAEHTISQTSRGNAPWTIVEGADARYRSLTVGTMILDGIRGRLAQVEAERAAQGRATRRPGGKAGRTKASSDGLGGASMLSSLAVAKERVKGNPEEQIFLAQGRLNLLQRKARARGVSTILVFEGWDAAGKGGAIRRVTASLDARDYQVLPIAAPTDEERAHHYLWRFWRHLSRAGRVTIFDRSWYGRVLVERVEGFATEKEWRRAYAEINQFEDQLSRHGIVLVKFWLHVTKEEQLRRFKEREAIEHKRWKLTEEDWRNRTKWNAYESAVNEMVERTSTRCAPWTLIDANDKAGARLNVLKTVGDRLEKALAKP
jgi:polyphosphate:AMP phosphotransferase